jgi:hypothetical protein
MTKAGKPNKVHPNRRSGSKVNFKNAVKLLGTDILSNKVLKAKLQMLKKRTKKQ